MGNGKSAVLRPVEQPSWKGGSQSEGRQGGHDPETKMRSLLDLPEKCGVCKGGHGWQVALWLDWRRERSRVF